MANTARKGNIKELRSAELFAAEGWVVGSRRHVAGPGDLLCVRLEPRDAEYAGTIYEDRQVGEALLVEVKARIHVYEGFRRQDRQEMLEYSAEHNLTPVLAWWRPRARTHELIFADAWPK